MLQLRIDFWLALGYVFKERASFFSIWNFDVNVVGVQAKHVLNGVIRG
jgi:hypothetical protein